MGTQINKMSIARRPVIVTNMVYKSIVVGSSGPFLASSAIAVTYDGTNTVYKLASATIADDAESFCGFIVKDTDIGGSASITTVRGAMIEPIIEGGGPLVVNQPVFLAITPGTVTTTPPVSTGTMLVRVGVAVSPTKMMLNTDARIMNM